MQPSARTLHGRFLQSLMIAASALAIQAGTVMAQAGKPAPVLQIPSHAAAAAPAAAETVLKRLPAGAEELTFRGETGSRTFKITLGRAEAARTGVFQMALLNAVSLLPERSAVKVTINGTVVAAAAAASPDTPDLIPVRIPPGLLVPGINTVQISAALTHRVDCSVKATYELWAKLDPAQTGFLLPRDAAFAIRSVEDLALEPLAADGTTRIHLRMGDNASDGDLSDAGRVIEAIVRRAGVLRPVVDAGPAPGNGPGFDLVLASGADATVALQGLAIVGRSEGVMLGRDGSNGRFTVLVTDPEAAATAVSGTPARAAPPLRAISQDGFRSSLADLGLGTEVFAGRHYTASIDVNLPPDFLSSNDRARLLLDGSHGSTLIEGSGLVFRVNGTLVSSMPLAAGRSERFQHAIVELPLRFFHPGHNDLSVEGTTSAAADAQCDTAIMTREPRLTIAGTSELEFPNFAHLATMPQIPAALTSATDGSEDVTHLYLLENDPASIGAGMTALANLAAVPGRISPPQVHRGAPGETEPPGLVIGRSSDLPATLASAVAAVTVAAPTVSESAEAERATADAAPAGVDAASAASLSGLSSGAASIASTAQAIMRDHGFFFTSESVYDRLPVTPDSLTITAVVPHTTRPAVGGIPFPQFRRDPSHWLVLTAADREHVASGLDRLVASGRWGSLAGEAATFNPADGSLRVLQPRTVSYVVPEKLVLSDIRPILGGIMSGNILLSIGALFVLLTVLGVATNTVIRRTGVK